MELMQAARERVGRQRLGSGARSRARLRRGGESDRVAWADLIEREDGHEDDAPRDWRARRRQRGGAEAHQGDIPASKQRALEERARVGGKGRSQEPRRNSTAWPGLQRTRA